ncbi:hypothetical protein J4457_04060, partial [Candidatus Woesearchaeota archaeon]|nr:hypothetical protein [Candidatus Woesearchaeota archaeon]
FIDPNDDTKKKVILGVPETADYISVELDDPSSGHTQKYLALKNYYKDMKYEEVSDSFTATLTHGGRLTNDPAKGFIIDGKKLILDFLGCMSFLEEQCGLRINGPPVGQIQEGQEIQLTDKITLKIEELEGYGCDEEINICQGSPDLGYSRIKVKVMIRQ